MNNQTMTEIILKCLWEIYKGAAIGYVTGSIIAFFVIRIIKSKILSCIKFWFMPHYWIMNGRVSENWDKELNTLLNKHEFIIINRFTAMLGDREIWIANYPYACFTPSGKIPKFRAKRSTILRAKKKLGKVDNYYPNVA